MNPAYFLLLLSPPLGAGEPQQGPLIGQWSNVTYLQASQSRTTLQAAATKIHLEAQDENA